MQMSTRRGSTEVHEFDGMFQGFSAHYKVTSVIGHVFRFCCFRSSPPKKKKKEKKKIKKSFKSLPLIHHY